MNILLTGATGFLGLRICELFSKDKYHVVGLGRDLERGASITKLGHVFYSCDLKSKESMRKYFENIDVVIHSGALSSAWGKKSEFYDVNVIGTQNVIDLSIEYKVEKFIHISSPSVYFKFKDQENINEGQPLPESFPSFYTWSKYQAECLVDKAFQQSDLNTITLRPRAIFGPGDRTLLPRLIRSARKNGLPRIGLGENIVDLTYVDNVVESIRCAIQANERCIGQKYNITNGEPINLWNFIEEIFKSIGIKRTQKKISFFKAYFFAYILEFLYRVFKLKGEPILTRYTVGLLAKTQTLDITKAKMDLGYIPKVPFKKGVERTLNQIASSSL